MINQNLWERFGFTMKEWREMPNSEKGKYLRRIRGMKIYENCQECKRPMFPRPCGTEALIGIYRRYTGMGIRFNDEHKWKWESMGAYSSNFAEGLLDRITKEETERGKQNEYHTKVVKGNEQGVKDDSKRDVRRSDEA